MQIREHTGTKRFRWIRTSHGRLGVAVAAAALALAVAAVMRPDPHTPTPTPQAAPAMAPARLADFSGAVPSPDARLVANWAVATGDNDKHAILMVDKKDARVYVFAPDGRLKDSAPALLGEAHGDDLLPGSGEKEPAQMTPEEKRTPAGRFVAEPGVNADHEDVIWVDYENAISMHRVRVVPQEQRRERLATPTTDDNRISFGCINLPRAFYEGVARPTVEQYGAVVYVLPELKSPQQVFGAYDVTDPAQVAAARQAQRTAHG